MWQWFSNYLLNPSATRVKRRMNVRMDIAALREAGRDMCRVRLALDSLLLGPDALGEAVPLCGLGGFRRRSSRAWHNQHRRRKRLRLLPGAGDGRKLKLQRAGMVASIRAAFRLQSPTNCISLSAI